MSIGHDPGLTDEHTRPRGSAGGCGCGGEDAHGVPVLDARSIPHAVRHGAILGALNQLQPGRSLVLVTPHDPKPLLAQVEAATPGRYALEYLERGPDAWQLAFTRTD